FGLELSTHRQIGGASKEIPVVIDRAIRFSRRIRAINASHTKQFSRSFAVAPSNDRRVNVVKAALLKKLMNGEGEPAANAKDTTKKIRTRTQVRDLAQEFRSMPLLLQRITFIGQADDSHVISN